MNKFIFAVIFFLFIKIDFVFCDPLHTREMMMQIVNSYGDPVSKTVKLYKIFGYYYELHRSGTSESYWRWTAPDANVVCDIGDNNTSSVIIFIGSLNWKKYNPQFFILLPKFPIGSNWKQKLKYRPFLCIWSIAFFYSLKADVI